MITKAARAQKKRRALLGMSLIVALFAHVLFIFLLQDAYIECSTPCNTIYSKHQTLSTIGKEELEKSKNRQLTEIFEELGPPIITVASIDPPDFNPDVHSMALQDVAFQDGEFNVHTDYSITEAAPDAFVKNHIPYKVDNDAPSLANALMIATDEITARPQQNTALAPDSQAGMIANIPMDASIDALDTENDPHATIAKSDDFFLDVQYAPRMDGRGYLFQVKFIPKDNVRFKRIRQNFFFLIDRSHSIDKSRYELTKAAVYHALQTLKHGDTFNILVFDDNVLRMSSHNNVWSKESVSAAKAFLDYAAYGGVFANTDIYSSLDKIIPNDVVDQEINTAILFTDGDVFKEQSQQRASIERWTKKNNGRVSLYCVAVGRGNNIPLLQLLSTNNKGTLLYKAQNEQIDEVMMSLMDSIGYPIGKEMILTAFSTDNNRSISVYPRPQRLPDLYDNSPYVIYGWVKERKPFHLFLQGKHYDRWLDIQQTVYFEHARLVDNSSLERNWAIQLAYDQYDAYLATGDTERLYEAKQLLAPYKVALPFQ